MTRSLKAGLALLLAAAPAALLALDVPEPAASVAAAPVVPLESRFELVSEIASPGLEAEISGILPVEGKPGQYYALVNKSPPYRPDQQPMVEEKHRGALVTFDSAGKILKSVPVADDAFGGLAYAKGRYYAALMNASEIVELDPETGAIGRRIPLPSPAGGLDYDPDADAFVAQLYVGHPQLLLVDRESGKAKASLWSEESAMGLVKIDGDWLCSWASGWDPGSFSELRVIDQKTGAVLERSMLDRVHSAMGAVPGRKSFIVLVTLDQASGKTAIREYRYRSGRTS